MGSKISRYFPSASPTISRLSSARDCATGDCSSERSEVKPEELRDLGSKRRSVEQSSDEQSSSRANSTAFTTRSPESRSTPASIKKKSTGYTSLRMASAATSTLPRAPAFQAPHATASSELTPTSATPKALATPFAVAMAIRTPVNEPGPRPTTTQEMSSRVIPHAETASSTRGKSWVLEALRAGITSLRRISTERLLASRIPRPIAITSFAVSNASTYDVFAINENLPQSSSVEL